MDEIIIIDGIFEKSAGRRNGSKAFYLWKKIPLKRPFRYRRGQTWFCIRRSNLHLLKMFEFFPQNIIRIFSTPEEPLISPLFIEVHLVFNKRTLRFSMRKDPLDFYEKNIGCSMIRPATLLWEDPLIFHLLLKTHVFNKKTPRSFMRSPCALLKLYPVDFHKKTLWNSSGLLYEKTFEHFHEKSFCALL